MSERAPAALSAYVIAVALTAALIAGAVAADLSLEPFPLTLAGALGGALAAVTDADRTERFIRTGGPDGDGSDGARGGHA